MNDDESKVIQRLPPRRGENEQPEVTGSPRRVEAGMSFRVAGRVARLLAVLVAALIVSGCMTPMASPGSETVPTSRAVSVRDSRPIESHDLFANAVRVAP